MTARQVKIRQVEDRIKSIKKQMQANEMRILYLDVLIEDAETRIGEAVI